MSSIVLTFVKLLYNAIFSFIQVRMCIKGAFENTWQKSANFQAQDLWKGIFFAEAVLPKALNLGLVESMIVQVVLLLIIKL